MFFTLCVIDNSTGGPIGVIIRYRSVRETILICPQAEDLASFIIFVDHTVRDSAFGFEHMIIRTKFLRCDLNAVVVERGGARSVISSSGHDRIGVRGGDDKETYIDKERFQRRRI